MVEISDRQARPLAGKDQSTAGITDACIGWDDSGAPDKLGCGRRRRLAETDAEANRCNSAAAITS
jgi:hypothetical protein